MENTINTSNIRMDNVRQKPWLIELVPWIGQGTCTALYPYVFLSRPVYKAIKSKAPDPYDTCRVIHEQEHINRAEKLGALRWHITYLVSKRFRFEEEVAACRPQFTYLKAKSLTFNFEKKAHNLSGWLYLWAIPYEEAYARLAMLWEDV